MRADRPADFSRIVKTHRQELGLTQQQLADRAGVTRQLIARLENGTGDPSLANTLRVLNALGIKLSTSEIREAPGNETLIPHAVWRAATLPTHDFSRFLTPQVQSQIASATSKALASLGSLPSIDPHIFLNGQKDSNAVQPEADHD